jgi:hypothetical protein
MRKLTESGITYTASMAKLREKAEQAQLAIDVVMAQESAAIQKHERIATEAKALRDHISDLVRGRADSALISTLEDELKDLDGMQREANLQVGALRVRVRALGEPLNAIKAELEVGEEAHRRLSDRTMKLREHIEKVAHA